MGKITSECGVSMSREGQQVVPNLGRCRMVDFIPPWRLHIAGMESMRSHVLDCVKQQLRFAMTAVCHTI